MLPILNCIAFSCPRSVLFGYSPSYRLKEVNEALEVLKTKKGNKILIPQESNLPTTLQIPVLNALTHLDVVQFKQNASQKTLGLAEEAADVVSCILSRELFSAKNMGVTRMNLPVTAKTTSNRFQELKSKATLIANAHSEWLDVLRLHVPASEKISEKTLKDALPALILYVHSHTSMSEDKDASPTLIQKEAKRLAQRKLDEEMEELHDAIADNKRLSAQKKKALFKKLRSISDLLLCRTPREDGVLNIVTHWGFKLKHGVFILLRVPTKPKEALTQLVSVVREGLDKPSIRLDDLLQYLTLKHTGRAEVLFTEPALEKDKKRQRTKGAEKLLEGYWFLDPHSPLLGNR